MYRKIKVVLLLYAMHNSDAIDKETGKEFKPEVLTFYNITKGGFDTVDQLKATYSVARRSCRWSLTVFFASRNIAGINSYVIQQQTNQVL